MKKIVLLSISMILLQDTHAHDNKTTQTSSMVSLDRIIKNEKKIALSLKNRTYYRGIFTGLKVLMGTATAVHTTADAVNTVAWCLGYNQPINNWRVSDYAPKSRTEAITNSVVSSLIAGLGMICLYTLFAKTEQQYGSAADIRWFVAAKSPFYITLRELYFLAQQASRAKDSQQLIKEMKNRFNKLIDQTENVLAFMRYKKEKLSAQKKLDAEHAINHLLEHIEPLYNDVAQAIAADAYGVTYHLDSVLMLLEGDCARFAQAEGSRWINPSAVLDMMQNFV